MGEAEMQIRDSKTPEQLWEEACPTLNDSARYHNGCCCWIFKKDARIPPYMQAEIERGRVLRIGEGLVKGGKQ